MFLVNWLATHFFARLDESFPDEEEGGHLAAEWESSLIAEEDLCSEESEKLKRVKGLWREVGVKMGVYHPKGIRFAVQRKKGMNSSVAIWHRGSPTIVIPVEYLSSTVLDSEARHQRDRGFNKQDWATWSRFIDGSPDSVEDMVDYAERFSKELPQNKLRKLAKRYGQLLSRVEFEAEMAHEFGHVQARHLNPRKGGRLSKFLRMVTGILLPSLIFVAAMGLSLLMREWTGSLDLLFPVLCGVAASLFFRVTVTDYLMQRSVSYVRKQWEREADAIAARSKSFCEGNVRLYKKDILTDIIQAKKSSGDIEELGRRIFKETDYHPSDGDRLSFFLGRLKQFEPTEKKANSEPLKGRIR